MSTALGASGGPGGIHVQRWNLGFEGRVGSGLSESPQPGTPHCLNKHRFGEVAQNVWVWFDLGEGIYFLAPDGGIDSAQRVSEIS